PVLQCPYARRYAANWAALDFCFTKQDFPQTGSQIFRFQTRILQFFVGAAQTANISHLPEELLKDGIA
ncbi:MAG: hypothetical protein ACRD9L_12640, partial [Bryobacteraceae bacterium]